jgi:hypothetical protein
VVHDYLWDVCEESTWVVPAHASVAVDLFSSETAFQLAETTTLLSALLDARVTARVRSEVAERVLEPYLADHSRYWWYRGSNNWNGVCNGAIGCSMLLLEEDVGRLAEGLALVLAGLEAYLYTAFGADGASTEGVGYWQYGLMNVVCFGEMLRQRTRGVVDLLGQVPELARIARYPLAMMLSPGRFASFSDSHEEHSFHPGLVTRLAERTGQPAVEHILAGEGMLTGLPTRLAMALRTMTWWDGVWPEGVAVTDGLLEQTGVVRLVGQHTDGVQLVVAMKAGHNDENHNHNDVGSFVVHANGETYLCDPGPGLYTGQYFGSERYENVFANSYGHSVPVIDGELQATGRSHRGDIVAYEPGTERKRAAAEIAAAYSLRGLKSLVRELLVVEDVTDGVTLTLSDTFSLTGSVGSVEEALMTWLDVRVAGSSAALVGESGTLDLEVVSPVGATFSLVALDQASVANAKSRVLKRLTVDVPPVPEATFTVRMRFTRSA